MIQVSAWLPDTKKNMEWLKGETRHYGEKYAVEIRKKVYHHGGDHYALFRSREEK
jgi:hypothetical protein